MDNAAAEAWWAGVGGGGGTERPGVFLDATGAYLRAVLELEEEHGAAPRRPELRARLGISRGSVSQQVTRLTADGTMRLGPDDRIVLTAAGRAAAVRVLRKHRLAERLLVDLVGLEWELAHLEASRWQHVLGERVERRLLDLLDDPTVSPYGNPVPGLAELVPDPPRPRPPCPGPTGTVLLSIAESLQCRPAALAALRAAEILPGRPVVVTAQPDGMVRVAGRSGELVLPAAVARGLTVHSAPRVPTRTGAPTSRAAAP